MARASALQAGGHRFESYNSHQRLLILREWLSGRALPCQGKCREFESRFPLQLKTVHWTVFSLTTGLLQDSSDVPSPKLRLDSRVFREFTTVVSVSRSTKNNQSNGCFLFLLYYKKLLKNVNNT